MKETPICMSSLSVRGILEGLKSQTRRPMKPQPVGLPKGARCAPYDGDLRAFAFFDASGKLLAGIEGDRQGTHRWKPHHLPGDRCWVRESWAGTADNPCYRADGFDLVNKWKPSLFMPRKISRISLEILAVRAEPLLAIGPDDCFREGCPLNHIRPTEWYWNLWDSIYPRGSWASNPWVWVYDFRRAVP